jgi:hypothetical protein
VSFRHDYDLFMAAAKVVPCRPSAGPETARVYEALELGCVPIVTDIPESGWPVPEGYAWRGYWEWLLGEKPPFPVIDGPDQLAGAMKEILDNWPESGRIVTGWWARYKRKINQVLRNDILELRNV